MFKSSLNQQSGGSGGGGTVTAVTSGPYTAGSAAGLGIYTVYNNSGAGFTFNLPASPAANQIAVIVDAALTSGSHSITVNGNGNTICAYGSTAGSYTIASNGGSLALAWDGTQWTQFA